MKQKKFGWKSVLLLLALVAVIGVVAVPVVIHAAGSQDEIDVDFGDLGGEETGSGDINMDGLVNEADLEALAKYIAGVEVTVDTRIIDVNNDGVVNSKDIVRLARYLAGQNVTAK